jgi:hypothetical protein
LHACYLLFVLFVNDLPSVIHHALARQFADDTQMAHQYDSRSPASMVLVQHELNEDLDRVHDWCKRNRLKLNAKKSVAMLIGHKTVTERLHVPVLKIGRAQIEYVESARNLGVTFDSEHNFNSHIDNVVKTAGRRLANLGRARLLMPSNVLRSMVETVVLPAALYGIETWSTCCPSYRTRVQRIQNWGARLITNRRKHDHVSDVDRLGWLRVDEQARLRITGTAYAASRGELGTDLKSLFTQPQHDYNTRDQAVGTFLRPHVPTNRGLRSFAFAGPSALNSVIDIVNRDLDKSEALSVL